jgi:hypothetical protein
VESSIALIRLSNFVLSRSGFPGLKACGIRRKSTCRANQCGGMRGSCPLRYGFSNGLRHRAGQSDHQMAAASPCQRSSEIESLALTAGVTFSPS